MEMINVDKKVIVDLVRLSEELNDKLESLELASDPELMNSLEKSKEEIKKREFSNWNEL
jgi:hypothetical protein